MGVSCSEWSGRQPRPAVGQHAVSPLEDAAPALAAHGYEPRVEGDAVVLANCPFHALAREHTALVCGINLHLITAMAAELGLPTVRATLQPATDRCCVRLTAEPS